jgi:sterol desaturase/sphingolipid hydroxylase (fatty acid hydroxylase superfamily)
MLFNRPLNKQSMWLDIRFFAINSLIYYLLMRSVVQISYLLATNLMDHGILKLFTEYQGFFSGTSSNKILATIVIFLCMDFGIFIAHYAFHHVPTLWLFHRVHHSAKTLTPFTMFRFHPLDDGLTALTAGFLSFIAIRLATFFISDFQAYSFEGVNIFLLIFYLTGFQLRHTHLWLVWPKPFSYFCISPAEHQIHHSSLAPHINKNFGFVLSIWDKLFKTHYPVSKTPEAYKIGIDEPSERIRTLRDCYLEPLERVAKHSVLLCAVLTFTISIVILRGLLL